ncbi:hypothetical protein pb186bvf_001418 [Paramecium bursaria]
MQILMQGLIIYSLSLMCFLLLGNQLIKWLIASDYDINSKIIELLFCLSFGLCVMALELFIFEIFQIDTESFRLKLWQYTLASLGLLILYIIPEVLFYKMTQKLFSRKCFRLTFCIFLTFCYYVLMKVYVFQSFYYFIDIQHQLDFITELGTVMIGILSGFGAVNCPFAYFQFISMNIQQVQEVKMEIVSNIYFLLREIEKAATKIALLDFNFKESSFTGKNRGIWSYLSFFSPKKQNKDLEQREDLANEINQLKEIHREFFEYYKEYTEEEKRYQFSRTLYGKFLKRLAWIVFIYCIYKMIMSMINFYLGRQKSIDPINRILKVILPFFGFTLDQDTYETLAIYGTFIFMGYLMISNVRSFSLNLINLFNSFMGIALLQKMPAEIMVCVLAEIFSVYLLSTSTRQVFGQFKSIYGKYRYFRTLQKL